MSILEKFWEYGVIKNAYLVHHMILAALGMAAIIYFGYELEGSIALFAIAVGFEYWQNKFNKRVLYDTMGDIIIPSLMALTMLLVAWGTAIPWVCFIVGVKYDRGQSLKKIFDPR